MRWLRDLAGLVLLLAAGLAQAALEVAVVLSESGGAYGAAATALSDALGRSPSAVSSVQVVPLAQGSAADTARVTVALGVAACEQRLQAPGDGALVCALVPRLAFERLLRASGRKASARLTAVYLSQPFERQLRLIRLALPAARRVGVLWGPESAPQAPALRTVAQRLGLQLVEATVTTEADLAPGLRQVLSGSEALLAVPDPTVYGSNTVRNILLTAFRSGVPLVGVSPAYVRSGALLAVYATAEHTARDTLPLVVQALQGRPWPSEPVYGSQFEVGVNQHLARSLGLSLEPQALGAQLRGFEVGR